MRKILPLLVVPALLLLTGAGCAGSTPPAATPPEAAAPAQPSSAAQGKAVITVTDDAPSLAGVTAVVLTVDEVDVHDASAGWITVSSAAQSYDLLKLKNASVSELLAQANLKAGTYDEIRVNVSNVSVTANGKTQTAKLPSKTLTILGNLTIVAAQTSTASLDFDLTKSLHLTGKGLYILAPVVKLETKNNVQVNIKADNTVEGNGGEVETSTSVGMDESGNVKNNFALPNKLEVDANGNIKVLGK